MGFDDLDLESLRLSQDFTSLAGVRKQLLSVPLRKPHKHEFFRTHPDPQWSFPASCLRLPGDRRDDLFIVTADLVPTLLVDPIPITFVATMTRQAVFLLWPLRLPGPDGRQDEWSRTALEACALAKAKWVRMAAKQALGSYEVFEAIGTFPEPTWPDLNWKAILQIAFRDHVIQDVDHPVLRQLRGEV